MTYLPAIEFVEVSPPIYEKLKSLGANSSKFSQKRKTIGEIIKKPIKTSSDLFFEVKKKINKYKIQAIDAVLDWSTRTLIKHTSTRNK